MESTPGHDIPSTIEVVDRWLVRAAESLYSTWDEAAGNFWRDSWREESDTATGEPDDASPLGRGKGATSNNRSFQALVAASRFFADYSLGEPKSLRTSMAAAVSEMVSKYYAVDLERIRSHGENHLNAYTDAQLLLSYCLALSPTTAETCALTLDGQGREAILQKVVELSTIVATQLGEGGVSVHKSARPHHFLTLHTVRALDTARRTLLANGISLPEDVSVVDRSDHPVLLAKIREDVVQQLGLHLLPAPGFDSSSLISSCALLGRFAGEADSPLLEQAVDALNADQSVRGTWTTAGVISFGRRKLVYVPSVELSLVLCNLALADLYEGETDIFDRAAPALHASLQLVQGSFTHHDQMSGWGNDRTRSGNEVESWTTAVVLSFLISYRKALSIRLQESILRKYRARRRPAGFTTFWADLDSIVPDEERQNVLRSQALSAGHFDDFLRLTDPTPHNSIVEGVRRDILEPTLVSVSQRPFSLSSFLLYGPPGTRKTSFVEAIARELDWPLLTLSPPAFLKKGIEGFEAAADEIFEDLLRLERVVVLFDECEEFFRHRPKNTKAAMESRTIGAFITSGMLPRLQRLHDARWIVFVINTNIEAFELDEAVTRRGRLDMVARVGHPSLQAQLRYLKIWETRTDPKKTLTQENLEWFESHLNLVEAEMGPKRDQLESDRGDVQRDNPDRGDEYREEMIKLHKREAKELKKVVTFSMLDSLANRCLGEGNESPILDAESLKENLDQEFDRFGPDSWIHESPR